MSGAIRRMRLASALLAAGLLAIGVAVYLAARPAPAPDLRTLGDCLGLVAAVWAAVGVAGGWLFRRALPPPRA